MPCACSFRRLFVVPEGHFFWNTYIEGPQVGDLNLWNSDNLNERFYSGKTRALHGSHITVGERMWSGFPALRPMATITDDSLSWYGIDEHGGSVHDVIGTRCDPYTNNLLFGGAISSLLPFKFDACFFRLYGNRAFRR